MLHLVWFLSCLVYDRNPKMCFFCSVFFFCIFFKAGFGKPFLVYNYPGNICARVNETRRATYYSRTCNARDLRQIWVWTPGNLLMNLFNYQCLEVHGRIRDYRNIYLSLCNSSTKNQKWRCNNHLCFGISSDKTPTTLTHALRYNSGKPTLLARIFSIIDMGSLWTVYPEGNKSVCAARSPEGKFIQLLLQNSSIFKVIRFLKLIHSLIIIFLAITWLL